MKKKTIWALATALLALATEAGSQVVEAGRLTTDIAESIARTEETRGTLCVPQPHDSFKFAIFTRFRYSV